MLERETIGKDVMDKSYQNALKLEPDDFTTSFQIRSTPILQDIQTIAPTMVGLKTDTKHLDLCLLKQDIECN